MKFDRELEFPEMLHLSIRMLQLSVSLTSLPLKTNKLRVYIILGVQRQQEPTEKV